MKLLTFLGIGKYEETAYVWQEKECVSCYAPVASCNFLAPSSLTVFLTEEAQGQVFPAFRAALPAPLEVCPVPIALGQSEPELWHIFGQVAAAVAPGEEVAFDITHGLRSFPLLGLLAAAFLRSGLRVALRAVLYGAYDVRDRTVIPNRTPMFDLTPMLALLEWAVAADRFNETGDARYLASLLGQQRKTLALAAGKDRAALEQVGNLGNLAGALVNISQSLRLIRPQQALDRIAGLPECIERARPAVERRAPAQPFSLLMQTIADTYVPLGLPEPTATAKAWANLERQRLMINWYADREQWAQAATLAREWVVSWTMAQIGQTNLAQKSARERVESVIGAEADDFVHAKKAGHPFAPMFLTQLPDAVDVLSMWVALTEARNDINHAGMRENSKEPETLIKQITRCVEELNLLPLGE